MSSDTAQHSFIIEIEGPLASFVHLRLFNGYDQEIAKAYQRLELKLPRGLYKLRVELNEWVENRIYRLTSDVLEQIKHKETYSSITASNLKSSHEYYTGPSRTWSDKLTVQPKNFIAEPGRLFLFFRNPNRERKSENNSLGKSFLLLNKNREVVYELTDNSIKEDIADGWLAFHTELAKGIYFLVYQGQGPTELPVYVCSNWQTQLFLTVTGTPLFNTLRILMARPGTSIADDEVAQLQLDSLLQKMHNGIYFVPRELVEQVASEKWQHPILAIAAAYAYLLSDEKTDDKLFHSIVDNLENRILCDSEAPDLKALRLIEALHFDRPIPPSPLVFPCMFMQGMKVFISQSLTNPGIVQQGSIAEKVIERIKPDSVWTLYEPLPLPVEEPPVEAKGGAVMRGGGARSKRKPAFRSSEVSPAVPAMTPETQKRDWITCSVFGELVFDKRDPVSVEQLASRLNLTPNIVQSHVNLLRSDENVLKAVAEEYVTENQEELGPVINKVQTNLSNIKS